MAVAESSIGHETARRSRPLPAKIELEAGKLRHDADNGTEDDAQRSSRSRFEEMASDAMRRLRAQFAEAAYSK